MSVRHVLEIDDLSRAELDRITAAAAPDAVFVHCLTAGDVGARPRRRRGAAMTEPTTTAPDGSGGDAGDGPPEAAPAPPARTLAKPQRQYRVSRLLAEHSVTSQGQLVDLLAAEGIAATQATVSRDLEDLGDQGAGGWRRVGLRHPRAALAAAGARGPPAPRVQRVGGRGGPLGQPGRAAHPPGRPTWSPRRSTGPTCPACWAPSPATTPSS